MKQLISTLIVLFSLACVHAQEGANNYSDQATGLRADGKIYVVIAVVVTILLGLFLYVILLDRRISKLEKES